MSEKILVVEDNELNLKLFCELLRAHGYAAEPVRDGREAVARAREFEPHLIVMDIQLPHISGLELIETLKGDEALQAIPIMAVTAYAARGDEERIRDAGAEGYVSKPISVIRFIEAVQELLAARAEAPASGESDPIAAAKTAPAPGPPTDLFSRRGDVPSQQGEGDREVSGVDPGVRRDDGEPKGETP